MIAQLRTKAKSISAFKVTEINEIELEKLSVFIKASSCSEYNFGIWSPTAFSVDTNQGTILVSTSDWLIDNDGTLFSRTNNFVEYHYDIVEETIASTPVVVETPVVVTPTVPIIPVVKVPDPIEEVKEVITPAVPIPGPIASQVVTEIAKPIPVAQTPVVPVTPVVAPVELPEIKTT